MSADHPSGRRPLEFLLVEDNPGDVRLMREALKEGQIPHRLRVATDGAQAMASLRDAERGGGRLPDIILLDLKLPGKSGHDVLAEIRADARLGRIPVVVLTSSEAEQEIARAGKLRADRYITKPMNLEQLVLVMKSVESFCFTCAGLPGGQGYGQMHDKSAAGRG